MPSSRCIRRKGIGLPRTGDSRDDSSPPFQPLGRNDHFGFLPVRSAAGMAAEAGAIHHDIGGLRKAYPWIS
jgi:hypothetical protein